MTVKYVLALIAVVFLAAAIGGGDRAEREACVSAIEATNTAAGVRTDYDGAYRSCRR